MSMSGSTTTPTWGHSDAREGSEGAWRGQEGQKEFVYRRPAQFESPTPKISGTLFRYSDTYSEGVLPLKKTGMGLTAPFSLRHWVSFCSIGYYGAER
jgi:hypothetical protein